MKIPTNGGVPVGATASLCEGEKRSINPELWQACAGPLVNLPPVATHVLYFPQGHSEQVAASMKKNVDAQVPSYPNLPSKLLCLLHNVTLHADPETDEVYAQMTLQPVPSVDKEALLRSDLAMKMHKPQTEFFCKTLTASDTSTHGGFSVPRRAAEKIFPPLDFSMQPPAQELRAKDLHDNHWTFRHIYRGQPKRHLLTTGWSLFVSGKRLVAGDSVLFIRDEKQQLLLGIRRANRQPTNLSSSVLSSDSMHIGILAAAAHADANKSPFTVFYNPRASPSEFVITLAKYYKAVFCNQISSGMRFRMMFETEDSGTRRYMGTVTGISDLDPIRWKNSQWRNLQVGWDESTTGEKRSRVSVWEIEPVTAPFFFCPPPFIRPKRPRQPGLPDDDVDNLFKRAMPWLGDDMSTKDPQAFPGLSLVQWLSMQQNPSFNSMQPNLMNSGSDISRQLGFSAPQVTQQSNMQLNSQSSPQQVQQLDQLSRMPVTLNQLNPMMQPQQSLVAQALPLTQTAVNQTLTSSQAPAQILQTQTQNSILQQQLHRSLPQNQQPQQQEIMGHSQFQNSAPPHLPDHQVPGSQMHLQILQRLHQQPQPPFLQQPAQLFSHDPQRQLLDVSQSFSRPLVPAEVFGLSTSQSILQSAIMRDMPGQVGLPPTLTPTNQLSTVGSGITDDIPSCSTSPSTNNCSNAAPSMVNGGTTQSGGEIVQSSAMLFSHLPQISNFKPSLNIPTSHNNHGVFAGGLIDCMDTSSSSATSASLNQNPNEPPLPVSQQPMQFRGMNHEGDDHKNSVPFGDGQLGMPIISEALLAQGMVDSSKNFLNNLSEGPLISGFEDHRDPQQELPSSVAGSQSFGVPDMSFNSIDSTLNDDSLLNRGPWAPTGQLPRMRTFTKVYKRGAVGRSIDITRYSGYDELKMDLARRFGIEGQLEDQHKIGWKLVYTDHEGDVLLVGDDPWEEFVSCVRCIKILSPQEVQQMSLDGDFGNSGVHNQACSSSDGGNA